MGIIPQYADVPVEIEIKRISNKIFCVFSLEMKKSHEYFGDNYHFKERKSCFFIAV